MTLVALGRSSCRCCSSLLAVIVAACSYIAHWQIHAGPTADMMLVELGRNNRQCLSSARQMSTRNCCSDPTDVD